MNLLRLVGILQTSETNSGPILLDSSKGLVLETEISLERDKIFTTSLEQYSIRLVYHFFV